MAADKDTTQIITVTANIITLDESLHLKFPQANFEEYFIEIILTNTQDTIAHFRIMTCSWAESFVFDNDSLDLHYPGCDSNFPTDLDIPPHKSVKFFSVLHYHGKKRSYDNPLSFKIGFVDLPYDESLRWPYKIVDKFKYKIYWSVKKKLICILYNYIEDFN